MNNELTCISIFSGAGGFDLGIEAAGFSTLLATDIDSHSCETLKAGKKQAALLKKPFLQKATIIERNIIHLEPKEILEVTGMDKGEIDLLIGGPPCQAFSVFGRRKGRNDPRGKIVDEYFKILAGVAPRVFVFENVYGLLTIDGGDVFKNVCKRLANPNKELSYRLSVHRLNAVNYSVPQFRDRVFVVGHIDGKEMERMPEWTVEQPKMQMGTKEWRTVEDALRGVPFIGNGNLPNHIGRKHSERIIERYGSLRPGERDHHTRINKLNLMKPSFTIIVGSDKGGGKGHVHPLEPREVTPRESARIQTFPDWWWFSGTSRHPIRQVGNAVPPMLAAAIGNTIGSQIFGRPKKQLRSILKVLDQNHLYAR